MSVAKCLGVVDLDASNMREARARWPHGRELSPDLPDVALEDLPRWMKAVEPPQRDAVLTALFAIAQHDPRAYLALAWLLMPGAAKEAGRIRRLADEIDEIVAGQLWIQMHEHDPANSTCVAARILDRVRRESMAELGVGDLAKRRDETWARTVVVDAFDDSTPNGVGDEESGDAEMLNDLIQRAIDAGALTELRPRPTSRPGSRGRVGRCPRPARARRAYDAIGDSDGRGGPRPVVPLDSPPCLPSGRGDP